MVVKSITIKNFRNHNYLSYDFGDNLNVIVGDNGVGKTNLVESIYYLSLARSFRTNEDDELIKDGKESAYIDAIIASGTNRHKVKISFLKGIRKVFVDDKPIKRLSELSNIVNIILFEPRDVMLFRGSPKYRRDYLDISLSKKSPTYLGYISQYEKLLKERNAILKQEKVDQDLLEATTEMMLKLSGPIISYRQQYVQDINNILDKIIYALTGERSHARMIYEPFVPYDTNFDTSAKNAFKKALEGDLKKKVTSIGIHREDFQMTLNDKNIASYGSQGENRLVAIALKLSPFFLIEDKDKRPIVILDDVMSELDKNHQERLIAFLRKFQQVFITGTKINLDDAKTYVLSKKGD